MERDFDEFYGAAAPRLVRQVYALTGDMGEAQDVVQEAFARAWQRWASVSQMDVPEAWVRTVATRLAVSRWRKLRNAAVAWQRATGPEVAPDVSPDQVVLVAALRRLPEAQRTAIVLHHLADLSVEEVSAQMGVKTGTTKARLSRGRAALAEILTPRAAVPPATVPPATVPPATVPPATVPPATVPPATVPPARGRRATAGADRPERGESSVAPL